MSQQCIPVLTLTLTTSALVANHRFVTVDGAHAGSGNNAIGVAQFSANPGEVLAVDVLGTSIVEAGAVLNAGIAVQSDANGRAVAVAGAGKIVGRALQASRAVGDRIEVLLIPN
jgi:hypothetical protein